MSEKLPYGEIHMSKIELRDALVKQIHENAALSNQVKTLEQQLKTAKADGVREFIPAIMVMDEPENIKGRFQSEWFWRGAFATRKLAEEYANNLEGK